MEPNKRARYAVVTAGAGGLGRTIALHLADAGWSVCVGDIDGEAVERLRNERPEIHTVTVDISSPDGVKAFFGSAAKYMGGLDLLVNNAGVSGPRGLVEDLPIADWKQCIDVNLTGMFLCLRQAIPVMKQRGKGCIVNISTASVGTGLPSRSAYIASKSAVEGLTRTLARELGPHGIRINAIRPGLLNGERARKVLSAIAQETEISTEAAAENLLTYVSTRRWIEPNEIARLVMFLADEHAINITGQTIGVCGNLEWEC